MAQAAQKVGYIHEEAWKANWLRVDSIHEVYYEQYGNKTGKPVIFLHGGPGFYTFKECTTFFDPKIYRVVLLDQRGCGKSKPLAELRKNTTWNLVEDIEALRKHLLVEKWHVVFGGSWGSTLALTYCQKYPASASSIVLRGIFAMREFELNWTLVSGASAMFPDKFEEFVNFLPENERANLIESYHKRILSDDRDISVPAAKAWNMWAISVSSPNKTSFQELEDEPWMLAHTQVNVHYFLHKAWLEEGQLLAKENIEKIRHIPAVIVQGRFDMICPPQTAWDLHKAWPEAQLHWIPDAGHSALEPGTFGKLVEVCDEYAQLPL